MIKKKFIRKRLLQKVRTKDTLSGIWETICKECDQRRQGKVKIERDGAHKYMVLLKIESFQFWNW